jgi:hypothetical protein
LFFSMILAIPKPAITYNSWNNDRYYVHVC